MNKDSVYMIVLITIATTSSLTFGVVQKIHQRQTILMNNTGDRYHGSEAKADFAKVYEEIGRIKSKVGLS